MKEILLLQSILTEGEGQKIEFKEKPSSLAPEITAFANSTGGRLFLGISDNGKIVKTPLTNRLKSQLTDTARNCDPPITIHLIDHPEGVIEIVVPEGQDKPYRCKEGFFLRIGPNSQKLTRDEIVRLIHHAGKIRFDEIMNNTFQFPNDFDFEVWEKYRGLAGYPKNSQSEEILTNIGVTSMQEGKVLFSNAAVLFFAKNPQRFFPEAKITCLKYLGDTRNEIQDKRECVGNILEQLEESLVFFDRYNAKQLKISGSPRHKEWEDYPAVVMREILINALIHRDYFYDSSHIYMHIYSHHLEVDNPGGLIQGLQLENLGNKAARRNRMLADLMQRAGYIENAGTGIARIREALQQNNNPPPEIIAANFFTVQLKIRPKNLVDDTLTDRQRILYSFVAEKKSVTKTDCQKILNVAGDTTLKELKILVAKGLIIVSGKGRNTRYSV
ncbi:MAG: ATP-binding protein [Deltaproteobacteria bacterium]|nr:ATP-binding protein [Deltaproteobacteria bacterium]